MQAKVMPKSFFSVVYNVATVNDPKADGNKQQAHFCDYLDGQEKGHKIYFVYIDSHLVDA